MAAREVGRSARSPSVTGSGDSGHVRLTLATCLFLICLAVVFLSGSRQCLAEDATPPISEFVVQPATITMGRFDRGAAVTVTVIARAATADVPTDPKLSFTASPGLEVAIGNRIAGAGDMVWPVTVRVTGDAPDDSAVDFRLAYAAAPAAPGRDATATTTPPTNPTPPSPQTIRVHRARLAVVIAPNRDASPVADADISIKTAFTNIISGKPGRAYLLIKNKSAYPFKVDTPDFAAPDFLTVAPELQIASGTNVPPFATLRVPLLVKVKEKEKSQSGEWLILASVTLRRGEGVAERTGTAVVEQKVNVDVPGVSEVLKLFDLPSLLLVPGALMLATWSLLLGAADATKHKWLEWKTTSFWVVAITISIVVFAAETKWGTNFLIGYNVEDVALLWLYCVGASAVTFFLYRGGMWGWNRYQANRAEAERLRAEAERRRREPLIDDKPLAIIRKLSLANSPSYLEPYERTVGGLTQTIFKLDFPATADGKVWAAPRMLVLRLQDTLDAKQAVGRVDAARNRPQDGFAPLVAALELGLKNKWIDLDWENGELSGPQPLPADQLGKVAGGGRTSPITIP